MYRIIYTYFHMEIAMKYLSDETMEGVSAGAQTFISGFLITGELSPNGTHAVAAPVSALGGATIAITNVLTNVGQLANLSSPYAPV